MGSSDAVRTAWDEWAQRELATFGGDRRTAAVEAALAAIESGLSPQAAVVAARLEAGAAVPAPELRVLWDEVQMMHRFAEDLGGVQPSGDLSAAGLTQLVAQYRARHKALLDLFNRATGTAAAGALPAQMRPAAGARPAAAPAPPGPSLREFFADNSILILSIAGAFLLIVATLLFEIYGSTGFGGEVRFTGVLILNLIFGAAGYLCFGRPRLRLVGQTYLAIFALMAPLTVAAAWVFLALDRRGISRELAVGIGGLGCSILYAILGLRLASRGYAALSMIALPVGWAGLMLAAHAGTWTSLWLTALVFAYTGVRYPPSALRGTLELFTRIAEPFIHLAALFALVWSLGQAISEFTVALDSSHLSLQLPATLALLTLGYGVYCWRSRRGWMLWVVWAGASLTVLSANEPLHLGERGYVLELALLAWTFAIGARWMPGRAVRNFVRVGAAIQAVAPIVLSAGPDWVMAVSLLATAGVGVLFAVEDREPAWLLLAAGIFAVDWFWLARSLLPPPAQATADTLILTYSPLPAIYGVIGLGLRLGGRARWSWPLYAVGGLIGLGVAANGAVQGDLTLAGRALAVYAGLAYVASAIERWWPGLAGAMVAAGAAVLLLLGAAGAASYWYPAAASVVAILIYAGHVAWSRPDLALTHRSTALAIAGLTAATSFAVPDFWARSSIGSATALASLLVTAVLVLVDGRLHRRPLFDYASAAVASLGGFWIARYLGIANIQASVILPGVVFIAAGLIAPHDRRRPATLAICRAAVIAGAVTLMGATAFQSVTEAAAASYTTLWVIEAVAALMIGIGARSRTLVLVGGAALGLGALRALFLILQQVQVYVVFGVIAILLLVGSGVLAATRDRLATARSAVRHSWDEWI
jgi:hypothetical protein